MYTVGFNFVKSGAHPVGWGYDIRPTVPLTGIVLHSTEGQAGSSFEAECKYVRDSPNVSAHYYVAKTGRIERILDPGPYRAWHAGKSSWFGRPDCNSFMIGIEMHHTHGEPYPISQLDALRWLVLQLMVDHPTITLPGIACHRWIALPLGRKKDPTDLDDAYWHAWIEGLTEPPDRPIIGPPTITPEKFAAVLEQAHSPMLEEAEAQDYYKALTDEGIDPSTWLAFSKHENGLGTNDGPCVPRKNSGCVRRPFKPSLAVGIDGGFALYPTWLNSVRDWALRLKGPWYAGAGLHSVRQVIPVYAPSSDGNKPEKYIAAVLEDMDTWQRESER